MAETLVKYPNPGALVEDLSLVPDRATGFYRAPNGSYIGFHRTLHDLDTALRPSTEGSVGGGVYVGNSEAVLASFSKVPYMKRLVVVELPCDESEVGVIWRPSSFDRRHFDEVNPRLEHPKKFLTWKPPFGNTIGCIAIGGTGNIPRKPRWGLWIDETTNVMPIAQIS